MDAVAVWMCGWMGKEVVKEEGGRWWCARVH